MENFTRGIFAGILIVFGTAPGYFGSPLAADDSLHRSSSAATQLAPEWKDARQISPPELVKRLAGPVSQRPGILQVGNHVLYEGAHIPGAIFAGPAASETGLALLRSVAEKIPRNKEVVIYCGCCPWEKCPNVHPAYDELRKMRFTNLVVLLIPQDFHHDWIVPGYPIERGR